MGGTLKMIRGRVLIVNSYSTLNRGDAAILDGLIATLRAAGAQHIAVAAPAADGEVERRMALGADEVVPMVIDVRQAPRLVRGAYPLLGIWVVWRLVWVSALAILRPRAVAPLRAYHSADLIVSAGGTFMGGSRPGMNILTGYQVLVSRFMRRQCLVAPQTVNPMTSSVARILSLMLRDAIVFTRDMPTERRLRRIGIDARRGADLAFRSPRVRRAAARPRPKHETFTIGWAPREFWSGTDAHRMRWEIEAAATEALTRLVRDYSARVLLIAQSNAFGVEDDTLVIRRLMTNLPADVRNHTDIVVPAVNIEQAVHQYAGLDVLYAFRLHAAILSILAGTPTLAVGYDPKVGGVFEELGIGDWVLEVAEASDAATVYSRLASSRNMDIGPRARDATLKADEINIELDAELRRRLQTLGS